MSKRKLLIFLWVILVNAFIFSLPSYSACSSRELIKVCTKCRDGALNSAQCMSTTTGPSCLDYNSLFSNLGNKYNVQVVTNDRRFYASDKIYSYQIELQTRPDSNGVFKYKLSTVNELGSRGIIGDDLIGYISFDSITFILLGIPFNGLSNALENGTLSYLPKVPLGESSCFAFFSNNSSNLEGECNNVVLQGGFANSPGIFSKAGVARIKVTLTPN